MRARMKVDYNESIRKGHMVYDDFATRMVRKGLAEEVVRAPRPKRPPRKKPN